MANYSVMDHFFSFGIAYITGGLVFIGIIVTCFTILQEKFHTFGMLTINDWHVGEILWTRASGTRQKSPNRTLKRVIFAMVNFVFLEMSKLVLE